MGIVVTQEERQSRGSAEPIEGRCASRLKLTNPSRYCTQYPLKNSNHCKVHGGKLGKGIANPNFKDGNHSRYLPKRMQADYDIAMEDPNLIGLRSDIATVDARLNDILKRVDTGEAGSLWTSLQGEYKAFQSARSSGDAAKMAETLASLGELIGKGKADWAVWGEAVGLIEQRRKLVDSEVKRLTALQVYVDSGQVLTMLNSIALQLREIIMDRDQSVNDQLLKTQNLLSRFLGASQQKANVPTIQSDD